MSEPRKSPSFDRSLVSGPLTPAIWKIVWPTLLMNLVAGLQGLVDHVMVGRLVGFEANAAIGVSWQIFLVVVVFIGSLYSGMGVLVARFAGANEQEKVNRVVSQVLRVSVFIGLGIFAPLGWVLAPRLLGLVHASPAVTAEALPYLRLLFVCGLGMMLFFMISGALRAAGDARTPLKLGILVTALNLVLNIVLIRGLGPIPALGTFGAALGTVTANALVAGLGVWWMYSGRLVVQLPKLVGWRLDWEILRSVVRFGLPTGFQGVVMNIGGVVLLRYVGSLEQSAAAQAAFAVGYTQLFSFMTWGSNALMAASLTITGQNLGAGRPDRASKAPLLCTVLGLCLAVPLAYLFAFHSQALLGIFGMEDPDVLALGGQLLIFLAVSSFLVTAALSYTGALQGAGDTKSPLYISLFSQLALPLGICFVLDQTRGLLPGDIWLAIVLGHLARCVLSVGRFLQGRWRDIEVK